MRSEHILKEDWFFFAITTFSDNINPEIDAVVI